MYPVLLSMCKVTTVHSHRELWTTLSYSQLQLTPSAMQKSIGEMYYKQHRTKKNSSKQ